MNLLLLAVLGGYAATALTITALHLLARWLERFTNALQAVLYGTDENGHPNPRPTK